MNIETLIELLLVAKSKGADCIDVVDAQGHEFKVDSVELNEGEFGKKVLIQVGSDW